MQHQGRKCHQDRKCNARQNMKCNIDVENAAINPLSQDRNFSIEVKMIKEPELILKQMARCCSCAMRKCSSLLTIPNTVVGQGRVYISFHVDIENEMNQEYQLLFFRLRKTSGSENQSPSWTFR